MLSYLWGGAKKPDQAPENDNPELAMRQALDAHGEFNQNQLDGTLQFEDFLVFRAVINRQAARMFLPMRDQLNERKLQAFRDKNQAEYVKIFREGQVEYQKCMKTITMKACEWIELEPQNYQITIK